MYLELFLFYLFAGIGSVFITIQTCKDDPEVENLGFFSEKVPMWFMILFAWICWLPILVWMLLKEYGDRPYD